MSKFKGFLPWLAIVFLCIVGVFIILYIPGYQFSGVCAIGLAGLVFCYHILHLLRRRTPKLSKILTGVLTVCLAIGLIAAAITGGFIIHTAIAIPQPDCEYLVVLGCGVNGTTPSMSLRERIEGAYLYLSENPNTICIVSGGQGFGENISEAACMFRELTAMGIAPERIWLEDKSTSTEENLRFSLDLIQKKTGTRPAVIGIISSEYHLFRAGLMAEALGVRSIPVPAQTKWLTLRINYFLREIVAVWYYGLFIF